jgi:hypothetical protein
MAKPVTPKAAATSKAPKAVKAPKAAVPGSPKPAKKKKYNDNLVNRILEDWSQPYDEYGPDGTYYPAAYDKYPYGSLTGRGK